MSDTVLSSSALDERPARLCHLRTLEPRVDATHRHDDVERPLPRLTRGGEVTSHEMAACGGRDESPCDEWSGGRAA